MTNFSCFADTLSYSQSFSNIIWHLTDQKAIPRLQIDFGKHNMPKDFVEQHTNLRSLAAGWAKSSYATRIDDYCEGERYLFFTYAYNGRQPFVYWFKDKDVVLQFDEFEDDLLFPSVSQETNYKLLPILMNEDYVYVSMDAYRFKELYEETKRKNKDWSYRTLLDSIDNQLTDDSNTLIIRYKKLNTINP